MNLNKGCIEIIIPNISFTYKIEMNLNKGCIEIVEFYHFHPWFYGWTLTRVVLKWRWGIQMDAQITDEP